MLLLVAVVVVQGGLLFLLSVFVERLDATPTFESAKEKKYKGMAPS